jgi:ankyrin repeat protein
MKKRTVTILFVSIATGAVVFTINKMQDNKIQKSEELGRVTQAGNMPHLLAPLVKQDSVRTLRPGGGDTGLDELRRQLDEGLDPNSRVDGEYLLTQAISDGNLEKVKLLLDRGASVTPPDFSVDYGLISLPLYLAVKKGDTESFRLLLAHGVDMSANLDPREGIHNNTLLDYAASGGSVEILQKIVDELGGFEKARKCWPDSHCDPGIEAIMHGHPQVLDWLKTQGYKFDADYLLGLAARVERPEMIDYLMAQVVSPSRDFFADNGFKNSFLTSGNPEILKQYLQWGGSIDFSDEETKELLSQATTVGKLEFLAAQDGGDKLLQDMKFKHLLMENVGDAEAFRLMLNKGLVDFDDPGALNRVFANKTSLELLDLALANGLSLTAGDFNGCQLLQWAASQGNESAVQFLLSKDVDINHQDAEGTTALIEAVHKGNYSVVEFLLEGGANPMMLEYDGKSALDHALRNGSSPKNILLINKLRELGVPEGKANPSN